jgi:hypothetical protein
MKSSFQVVFPPQKPVKKFFSFASKQKEKLFFIFIEKRNFSKLKKPSKVKKSLMISKYDTGCHLQPSLSYVEKQENFN